ncbi:MAG: ATP-dependent sacrificial sulfur transferase LarE [Lachnospiraceae bacterium]|nr:ATP-dependent sacrificial sulfur transferase LarE [Lachnospiraceae bacterium]MDE6185273.1 ATP-dependent sacrificial sulfur transferase LarE [Lachnospiraceae bacterium]
MEEYTEKRRKLIHKMAQYASQDVAVAFSGGVDSCLILKLACAAAEETGNRVYAITMQTRLHPNGEIEEARKVCEEIGAVHIVIAADELEGAGIMSNPVNRCYLCKRYLFLKMRERADELLVSVILEGTNEDDLHVYRPGIQALRELQITSPLAEIGFTKAEVRRMAGEYGLTSAKKPSAPCLATRFPYGTELSYERMAQVEKGETFLKGFGLHNVRIRVHDKLARIEVDESIFVDFLSHKEEIISYLKNLGFVYITLDMEGFRSGSMDVEISKKM